MDSTPFDSTPGFKSHSNSAVAAEEWLLFAFQTLNEKLSLEASNPESLW